MLPHILTHAAAISGIMDKQRESMFAVFEQREKIPDRPRESAPRRRSFAAFA